MAKLLTRKNNRLKNYNYSDNGYYFVAVCSKDRENIFGEYKNVVGAGLAPVRYNVPVRDNNTNNVKLSKLGQIINHQWNNIPKQYDNVELVWLVDGLQLVTCSLQLIPY